MFLFYVNFICIFITIFQTGIGLDWNTTLKKIVGLGSDGAAVMVGKKSGVAALLKENHPSIISVHCLAHRYNF
jgi:hypothetical protein